VAPPLFNVSRCCGALIFPWLSPLIDSDTCLAAGAGNPSPAYFDGFDDVLSDDPGFVAHLERFARHIDGCLAAGQPVEVLGPLEDPLIIPEQRGELGWPALLDLAAVLQAAAGASGHLPANLSTPGGARVGWAAFTGPWPRPIC
jgi:hypothetical protein